MITGGVYHVTSGLNSADEPINVRVFLSGREHLPSQILLSGVLFDEIAAGATVNATTKVDILGNGMSVRWLTATCMPVSGVAGSTRFGARIRSGSRRTILRNCDIGPWIAGDVTLYATNTLLIRGGRVGPDP